MAGLLTLVQSERLTLDEINGPWTWMIVNEYAIQQVADSEQLLSAMIAHESFASGVDHEDHSHGPYLVAALDPSSYESADISTVLRHFADWITNEGPNVPLDPEPILSREIQPRLAGQHFFVLRDHRSSDRSALSQNAETIGSWIEAVAIDRVEKRLRAIVCGSD